MQPLLAKWPQKKRNVLFGPILLGTFLFGFIVGAIVSPEFVVALLIGSFVGVSGTYALVGWPHFTTKKGDPVVPPHVKPWLFFPVAPLAAAAVYVVLGVFLTPVLPPDLLPYVMLTIGTIVGCAFAYLVVGFPDIPGMVTRTWARIPENRRPWLFFPLGVVLTLLAYFLVGLAFTQFTSDLIPLEVQPLIVLPIALLIGFASAFGLVGFPRPEKPLKEYLPDVPGRNRPAAFLLTWVVLGFPFTYGAGVGLNLVDALAHDLVLPLALVAGYAVAGGAAVAMWGTPRRWQEDPEYEPGIPESARAALFLPVVLVAALTGAVLVNLAGFDLFWGLLPGTVLGLALAVKVTGLGKRLNELRGESPYLLPELPDKVKPLVLFPLWLVLTAAFTMPAAYAFPDLLGAILAVATLIAFTVAVAAVEEPTLRALLARRREEKARQKAMKARREEALKGADPKARA